MCEPALVLSDSYSRLMGSVLAFREASLSHGTQPLLTDFIGQSEYAGLGYRHGLVTVTICATEDYSWDRDGYPVDARVRIRVLCDRPILSSSSRAD